MRSVSASSTPTALISALVAAFFFISTGCTPRVSPDVAAAEGMAALGEPYRLQVGATVMVAGEDLRLWLISVSQDSRCAPGVQCIAAGDAVVRLDVARAFGESASLRLNLTDAATTTYDRYTIKLVEVSPPPRAGQTIPANDYVATLLVTRS